MFRMVKELIKEAVDRFISRFLGGEERAVCALILPKDLPPVDLVKLCWATDAVWVRAEEFARHPAFSPDLTSLLDEVGNEIDGDEGEAWIALVDGQRLTTIDEGAAIINKVEKFFAK